MSQVGRATSFFSCNSPQLGNFLLLIKREPIPCPFKVFLQGHTLLNVVSNSGVSHSGVVSELFGKFNSVFLGRPYARWSFGKTSLNS